MNWFTKKQEELLSKIKPIVREIPSEFTTSYVANKIDEDKWITGTTLGNHKDELKIEKTKFGHWKKIEGRE